VASCGADVACVITERQLLRVRLSDATVERRLALPAGTVDTRQPELVERLVSSADGRLLAIVTPQGRLRVLDAATGQVVREFTGASGDLHALTFSPDGSSVTAADHTDVLIWPLQGGGQPERHEVHGGRVAAAAWSPDGTTLATLGSDGAVVLLDMTGRRRLGAVLTRGLGRTTTLWATREAFLAGQVDGTLLFIDPANGAVHAASEHPHSTAIDSARAGATGNLLVTADHFGLTGVWDLRSRRYLGAIDLPSEPDVFAYSAYVSPDGRLAATVHSSMGPVIVDLATRRVVRQLPPLPPPAPVVPGYLDVVGWTPDGRSILILRQLTTSSSDLLVVDATSGAVRLRVDTGEALAQDATADPMGRYLVIGTTTGRLLIVDAEDGHSLAPPLQANTGAVLNVSVSPDGRYVAASGQPPRLTLWDTRTFRQVADPLPIDVNAVDARARFAPDGRLIVASGAALRAFTVDPAQWLSRACREAGRVLTREEFEEVLPGRPYAPACA
jgi:WD40 repeat protein